MGFHGHRASRHGTVLWIDHRGDSLIAPSPTSVASAPGELRAQALWSAAERVVAAATISVLAIHIGVGFGLTPGYLLAIGLTPVWIRHVRRYSGGVVLVALGLLAVISGLIVTAFSSGSHDITQNEFTAAIGTMLGLIAAVGVLLWARTMMKPGTVALFFFVGMAVAAMLQRDYLTELNPLKFSWSIPISVAVLGLAMQSGKLPRQIVALVGLALMCGYAEFRSLLGTCLLAAILVTWQLRSKIHSRQLSWIFTSLLMGALAVAIYFTVSTLLVEGFLGVDAQEKSIEQIDTSGSLILGGRPEIAATTALFTYQPLGFGMGIAPSTADVLVAKAGMIKINYDPNNGYVDDYMFGNKFELHSTAADLWATYGPGGLLLAAFIALTVVRSLAISISHRRASGLVLILGLWTMWNLFFSPILATLPTLILGLGLLLLSREEPVTPVLAPQSVDDREAEPETSGDGR